MYQKYVFNENNQPHYCIDSGSCRLPFADWAQLCRMGSGRNRSRSICSKPDPTNFLTLISVCPTIAYRYFRALIRLASFQNLIFPICHRINFWLFRSSCPTIFLLRLLKIVLHGLSYYQLMVQPGMFYLQSIPLLAWHW
jgi:hypothetical protein